MVSFAADPDLDFVRFEPLPIGKLAAELGKSYSAVIRWTKRSINPLKMKPIGKTPCTTRVAFQRFVDGGFSAPERNIDSHPGQEAEEAVLRRMGVKF